MKFSHTVVYLVRGFSPPNSDLVIVDDPASGMRCWLTADVDSHLLDGDRSLVLGGLMLRGMFNPKYTGDELTAHLTAGVEEVRSSRSKKAPNAAFLVLRVSGDVEAFAADNEREMAEFVVCFDGCNKEDIRSRCNARYAAVLNAVVAETGTVVAFEKVHDSVVFMRADGKSVYSYTLSAGAARAYSSRRVTDAEASAIATLYPKLASDSSLQRVQRLIRLSLENEDPLRSFLAAWSAFEILVNKVFNAYEESFFRRMLEDGQPESQRKYLSRIREVMKDKYRLLDKFAAMGSQLSPSTVDQDFKFVTDVKKVRDTLAHGEEVDETSLQAREISNLASKYLRLHLLK